MCGAIEEPPITVAYSERENAAVATIGMAFVTGLLMTPDVALIV